MFQDPDKQLFSASVEQEISFGILNLGVAKEQARTEVEQVMEELEIVPFRKRPVHALSGGQKKTGLDRGYFSDASGDHHFG